MHTYASVKTKAPLYTTTAHPLGLLARPRYHHTTPPRHTIQVLLHHTWFVCIYIRIKSGDLRRFLRPPNNYLMLTSSIEPALMNVSVM